MRGDAQMIEHLNKILYNELTAINQYFLHARMFKDKGFNKLNKKEHEESLDEMRHADTLIERILFLEGLPNLQNLGKLLIGENVKEMLECDLQLEMSSLPDLQAAILHAEKINDYVSRDLLRKIMDNEEEHIDWLETQLKLISQVGIENYCQSQI